MRIMNLKTVWNEETIPLIISLIVTFAEYFSFKPNSVILLILFLVQYTTIREFRDILKIIRNNLKKDLLIDRDELQRLSKRLENEGEETQGAKKNMQSEKYVVYVDDNFHYMDESERYKLGAFGTCEEATAACKKIVDEFLERGYKKGMSFNDLYQGYIGFGEDPFIISADKTCFFSAWDYAKRRCRELCDEE